MADRANVTSTEPLERFRAALIKYQERAAAALHEMGDDVRRTRNWVQQDRLPHWHNEIHRRTRALNDAQQRLFSAELSAFRETAGEEKRAMLRCREALREAEEKLRLTRKWDQNFDSTIGPLAKQVDNLRNLVDDELPRAIHALTTMIRALEEYSEVRPSGPAEPPSS
jgi:hypothetical protein